jgi:hypothetical protein
VRLLPVILLTIPAATIACTGGQSHTNSAQQLSQSLQGAWLLQSYRSKVPLELPLQGLLNAQIGLLQVSVDGSALTVSGPGLTVSRTLQVQEVVDQTATVFVTEPTGVSLRVWIEFQEGGRSLIFRPLDAPWTGEGTLKRL